MRGSQQACPTPCTRPAALPQLVHTTCTSDKRLSMSDDGRERELPAEAPMNTDGGSGRGGGRSDVSSEQWGCQALAKAPSAALGVATRRMQPMAGVPALLAPAEPLMSLVVLCYRAVSAPLEQPPSTQGCAATAITADGRRFAAPALPAFRLPHTAPQTHCCGLCAGSITVQVLCGWHQLALGRCQAQGR